MPFFRLRSASPTFLALLLSSTIGATAPAFAADVVLTLNTDRVQEATQAPALDRAVTRFTGMASGSYYWPEGLLAEQLIEGLSSRHDRKAQALPGGLQLVSSYRRPYGGSERAAVLVDSRSGDVLAAALVHRQCGKDSSSTGCLDDQHAVLSVFLRPGFDRAKAQPLMAWSREVPETLQFGEGEKIATTEYATLDAAHTAARPVERPTGFSTDVPLYPKSQIYRTAQDALSDAKARRVLRLQTTDSMEQVLAFYKKLSPPLEEMESNLDARSGYVAGTRKGVAFSVGVKHGRDMLAITNIEVEISE
ncbi:hypothetical protein [Variovorax sp. PAMC26660]|uniref:hypothetical protein n=1 Tax=Variovorax sp. PAMC26660 TaxID=2762322 RepID=UPI00164E3E24|nr:hypothetical protein [Variovorax sp. PAMC26660]QNK66253.1 hypothetical protein H7F35_24070 [Variovorax sp. PAMC26660]